MTIHTKWMHVLRQDAAPEAFGNTIPHAVEGSFIDGQIKLMKSDSIQTWSHFLYSQFTRIINRHFNEYGCKTVVLAFDDKRFVPKAKAITQLKRRAGVQIIDFDESQALPNEVPSQWLEAIQNPNFKNKVIQLVCDAIPTLVKAPPGSTLIVDWQHIDVYTFSEEEDGTSKEEEASSTVGEADIKFAWWMRRLRAPMLIEATDGDYIPISLGLRADGIHLPVCILKGIHDDRPEFIDITRLHTCICESFQRYAPPNAIWHVQLFIALLGLSGTDFTRNLPLVSPCKIWASLPLIIRTFRMQSTVEIDPAAGKRMVELLYAEAFPKHIDPMSRASLWHQAQVSKLGARNKALIPRDARIMCTMRNINFLMHYWISTTPGDDDLQEFGFRIGSEGQVEWDD